MVGFRLDDASDGHRHRVGIVFGLVTKLGNIVVTDDAELVTARAQAHSGSSWLEKRRKLCR